MSNPSPRSKPCLHPWAGTVAIVVAVLLQLLLVRPARAEEFPVGFRTYSIPSGAMKPTLLVGDYALAISAPEPKRGDVVTYRLPRDPSITYVKRIVGLGGDRIQMIDGALHINGQAVKRE